MKGKTFIEVSFSSSSDAQHNTAVFYIIGETFIFSLSRYGNIKIVEGLILIIGTVYLD